MGSEVQFENFELAFSGRISGCRRTCECGVEYWDSHNSGYDWDEGEREALADNPNAKPLNHGVGLIEFEGRYYVDGCTCWHDRARRLIAFIVGHDEAIADFLTREKARKQSEADRSPVVAEASR